MERRSAKRTQKEQTKKHTHKNLCIQIMCSIAAFYTNFLFKKKNENNWTDAQTHSFYTCFGNGEQVLFFEIVRVLQAKVRFRRDRERERE